jgi:hypothetical protein
MFKGRLSLYFVKTKPEESAAFPCFRADWPRQAKLLAETLAVCLYGRVFDATHPCRAGYSPQTG